MSPQVTREQVEKILKFLTPHPLMTWHLNKDGTITAINAIGQKFILTTEKIHLADLMETKDDPPPPPPPTPRRKPTKK